MVHLTSVRYRNQNFSVLVCSQLNGKMAIESVNGHHIKDVPNLIAKMASVKIASTLEAYNNPKIPVIESQYYDDKYFSSHNDFQFD